MLCQKILFNIVLSMQMFLLSLASDDFIYVFACVLAALEPTLAAAGEYPRLLYYCTNYSELKSYRFEIEL